MHDYLFEHQEALEDEDLEVYAQKVGLDMAAFISQIAGGGVGGGVLMAIVGAIKQAMAKQ